MGNYYLHYLYRDHCHNFCWYYHNVLTDNHFVDIIRKVQRTITTNFFFAIIITFQWKISITFVDMITTFRRIIGIISLDIITKFRWIISIIFVITITFRKTVGIVFFDITTFRRIVSIILTLLKRSDRPLASLLLKL